MKILAVLDIVLIVLFLAMAIIVREKEHETLPNVINQKEIEHSIIVLKNAALGLSVLSLITTAGGLEEFVFQHSPWQALLASFSIQSILLIFSLMFFQFSIKINSIKSQALQYVSLTIMVFFFVASLLFSSSFSYVYIANNIYDEELRLNDYNNYIDKYFTEKFYTIKQETEKIGEALKKELNNQIFNLTSIFPVTSTTDDIKASLKSAYISEKNSSKTNPFIMNSLDFTDRQKSDVESIENVFNNFYQTYNDIIQNKIPEFNSAIEKAKSADDMETIIKHLNQVIDNLDTQKSNLDDIEFIFTHSTNNKIKIWKSQTENQYDDLIYTLKTSSDNLQDLNSGVKSMEEDIDRSKDTELTLSRLIQEFYLPADNSINDDTKSMNNYINKITENINLILEDSNNNEIDTNKLQKMTDALNYFQNYQKYINLKYKVDGFINIELSKNYIINNSAIDSDSNDSGETNPDSINNFDNIIYLAKEEWSSNRNKNFLELVDCLKELQNLAEYTDTKLNLDGNELIKETYKTKRDLLENISPFERAINYFSYDYSALAVFSLFIALFLDLGSFLAGLFIFVTKYFI